MLLRSHSRGREIDQLRRAADRPEVYDHQGAVCDAPGCYTPLSRFNPGPECWTHKPEQYTFVDSVEALRELMEQPA